MGLVCFRKKTFAVFYGLRKEVRIPGVGFLIEFRDLGCGFRIWGLGLKAYRSRVCSQSVMSKLQLRALSLTPPATHTHKLGYPTTKTL